MARTAMHSMASGNASLDSSARLPSGTNNVIGMFCRAISSNAARVARSLSARVTDRLDLEVIGHLAGQPYGSVGLGSNCRQSVDREQRVRGKHAELPTAPFRDVSGDVETKRARCKRSELALDNTRRLAHEGVVARADRGLPRCALHAYRRLRRGLSRDPFDLDRAFGCPDVDPNLHYRKKTSVLISSNPSSRSELCSTSI